MKVIHKQFKDLSLKLDLGLYQNLSLLPTKLFEYKSTDFLEFKFKNNTKLWTLRELFQIQTFDGFN